MNQGKFNINVPRWNEGGGTIANFGQEGYCIDGASGLVHAEICARPTDGGCFMYHVPNHWYPEIGKDNMPVSYQWRHDGMFDEMKFQREQGWGSIGVPNYERQYWSPNGMNLQGKRGGSIGMSNYEQRSLQMGGIDLWGVTKELKYRDGGNDGIGRSTMSVIRGDGVRESIFANRMTIMPKERDGLSQLDSILFLMSSIDEKNDRVIEFHVRSLAVFQCYRNLLESWDVPTCFHHDESKLTLVLGDEVFLVALQFAHAMLHRKDGFIAGKGGSIDDVGYDRALMLAFARIHFMNKR